VLRRPGGERVVVVARNNDTLQFLRPLRWAAPRLVVNDSVPGRKRR